MTEKINIEECPGQLEWSAFGAGYPDTACDLSMNWPEGSKYVPSGVLLDLDDDLVREGPPCPWHDAMGFTEYLIGGGYKVPLCSEGEHRVPAGTAIHYHDGTALWWSVACPEHGETRALMRDMSEQEGFEDSTFEPWGTTKPEEASV